MVKIKDGILQGDRTTDMNAMLFQQLTKSVVSPYQELLAYEYLYSLDGMTLRKITGMTVDLGKTPSQALQDEFGLFDARDTDGYRTVADYLDGKMGSFDMAINGTPSWPASLSDSQRPAPVLYSRGSMGLMNARSISVVGARKATVRGLDTAATVARNLVESDIVVVTGLAAGIDTAATKSALKHGASKAIGVIGTPIDECYPKENTRLVDAMLDEGCLIVSQVPFYRYSVQPFNTKRYYFPERNELMAAISDATLIIEASDTSGTLTQARACQHQGRPLFIMRDCLEDPSLSWPRKWACKPMTFIVDSAEDAVSIMNDMSLWRDCHASSD